MLDSNHNTGQSFFVTDDRGNLMKISKSTIFEISNDVPFHQMKPRFAGQLQGGIISGGESELKNWQQFAQAQIDPSDFTRKSGWQNSPGQQRTTLKNTSSISQHTSALGEVKMSGSQMPYRYSAIDDANSTLQRGDVRSNGSR